MTRIDGKVAVLAVESRERRISSDEAVDVQIVDPLDCKPTRLPAAAKFRELTIPAGTMLTIRLETPVASNTSRVDEPIEGTLSDPQIVDRTVVLPVGSRVRGFVAEAKPSGKVKGRARLGIRLDKVTDPSGATYPIAGSLAAEARRTTRRDAGTIGIPAAGGAILGAIVGGGKGAAVGATIGGGAGTVAVVATPGDEVQWPRGAALSFRLSRDLEVRVPITRNVT